MKPTIGEDLSQEDKRDKIRSQLTYELTNPEPELNKRYVSKSGLCKRNRFLEKAREQKKNDHVRL
jgi:hypothetical protein